MKQLTVITLGLLSFSWSLCASADVTCAAQQLAQGGSWDVVCSDDGSQNTDYFCNVDLTVTTQYDDTSSDLLINGRVGQNQQNVAIWFAAQVGGQNITSASINNVDCDAQDL